MILITAVAGLVGPDLALGEVLAGVGSPKASARS